jgi:hypothetical protein
MIDQRLREGEQDRLVLLDDRECLLQCSMKDERLASLRQITPAIAFAL